MVFKELACKYYLLSKENIYGVKQAKDDAANQANYPHLPAEQILAIHIKSR
jgi:hypothetical protein